MTYGSQRTRKAYKGVNHFAIWGWKCITNTSILFLVNKNLRTLHNNYLTKSCQWYMNSPFQQPYTHICFLFTAREWDSTGLTWPHYLRWAVKVHIAIPVLGALNATTLQLDRTGKNIWLNDTMISASSCAINIVRERWHSEGWAIVMFLPMCLTHPFLLYPVNKVLLVWVIPVVHNECLEPTSGLRLNLEGKSIFIHDSILNYLITFFFS